MRRRSTPGPGPWSGPWPPRPARRTTRSRRFPPTHRAGIGSSDWPSSSGSSVCGGGGRVAGRREPQARRRGPPPARPDPRGVVCALPAPGARGWARPPMPSRPRASPDRDPKGPALADLAYPVAERQRLFADLDLIVPSGQVGHANRALAAALDAEAVVGELRPASTSGSARRRSARRRSPRPPRWDWRSISIAPRWRARWVWPSISTSSSPGPTHWCWAGSARHPGARGLGGAGWLPGLGGRHPTSTGGTARPGPALPGHPRPTPGAATADAETVVALARRWQAGAMLAAAVTDAWGELDLDRPDPDEGLAGQLVAWAAAYHARSVNGWCSTAHRRPGYGYWRQLVGVAMVSGATDRLRYCAPCSAPGRATWRTPAGRWAGTCTGRSASAGRADQEPAGELGRRVGDDPGLRA